MPNSAVGSQPYVSPFKAEWRGLSPAPVTTRRTPPLRDWGEVYTARLEQAGMPAWAIRHEGVSHEFFRLADAVAARPRRGGKGGGFYEGGVRRAVFAVARHSPRFEGTKGRRYEIQSVGGRRVAGSSVRIWSLNPALAASLTAVCGGQSRFARAAT